MLALPGIDPNDFQKMLVSMVASIPGSEYESFIPSQHAWGLIPSQGVWEPHSQAPRL